jgi:hypothetical protein
LSKMMRLTLPNTWYRVTAMAAMLALCSLPDARAQDAPPPQGVSRGENFSAKPPAALFASDCTGAGCHKGPQGLGKKGAGLGGLAGFLREHYTNSRESAAALANYLTGQPSGPAPKEARTPKPGTTPSATSSAAPGAKPATAAAPASGSANWFEGASSEGRPGSNDPHKPKDAAHTPPGRGPHTAAKPDAAVKPETGKPDGLIKEEPSAAPAEAASQRPADEPAEKPAESAAKPAEAPSKANARAQRGRHPAAAANAAAVPVAAPEPEQAAAPPPPLPAPKQYDIFD